MNIDIPNIPKISAHLATTPIAIERSIGDFDRLVELPTTKKMATHAVAETMTKKPKEKKTESEIEDSRNEAINNKLLNEYKKKGGVETIYANTSAEIRNIFSNNPSENLAIVCEKNSFPVLLEFRKPDYINFDMVIIVEGQSYTDPKIAKEQLKHAIQKHKNEGFIITKANLGMPFKTGDKEMNLIYRHLANELAEIIENSKHIEDMYVEVTEYETEQVDKKEGVVFVAEIDEGKHFTSTKMNGELIPSSYEYTSRFA
ncbi:MAG: hypothetical protein WCH58_04205 [Candidatus Saccharibacteria bacterium]